ncbi:MAG: HlyD family efflux transporter periplasmic adaptor subunit [Nitrospiraceae bacterium]|nr:MAG: HlyD family efflux transporter periplasmic adaptor subunit [Nitrospiraceae bacterium]
MKKRLLIAGILLLIAAGVFVLRNFSGKQDDGKLILSGNVEVTEVDAGFKYAGRVTELPVEEGQRVQLGDRLASLDSAELESQALQGRAYLDEARTKLEELRAGARPQEIEEAKANVRYADAELSKAGKDHERAEVLFKNGAISAQAMDAARKAYDSAASQHRKAVESLSLVQEGPRKEQIAAANYRVRQAAAGLRTIEERLKETVIFAPVSGVILRKNIERGETVAPGTPVCTIGDLETPWIKVYVREEKLGLVKLGQKAGISVDSYPNKIYEGRVTYIASEAEFTPKNIQTQEERVKLVFGVKVSVKNVNDELKPGMPADVKISLK